MLSLSPCLGIFLNLTFGQISDSVGRIRVLLPVAAVALVFTYPIFALLVHYKSAPVLLLAVAWLAILNGTSAGPLYAVISEIFPTQIRSTGMALSYNAGVVVFAGLAPFAFTSLIAATGSAVAPGLCLMGLALVSMLSLIVLHRDLTSR